MVVISAVQRLAASRSRPQPQIGCSCGQDFDQRAAAAAVRPTGSYQFLSSGIFLPVPILCAPYRFLPGGYRCGCHIGMWIGWLRLWLRFHQDQNGSAAAGCRRMLEQHW